MYNPSILSCLGHKTVLHVVLCPFRTWLTGLGWPLIFLASSRCEHHQPFQCNKNKVWDLWKWNYRVNSVLILSLQIMSFLHEQTCRLQMLLTYQNTSVMITFVWKIYIFLNYAFCKIERVYSAFLWSLCMTLILSLLQRHFLT